MGQLGMKHCGVINTDTRWGKCATHAWDPPTQGWGYPGAGGPRDLKIFSSGIFNFHRGSDGPLGGKPPPRGTGRTPLGGDTPTLPPVTDLKKKVDGEPGARGFSWGAGSQPVAPSGEPGAPWGVRWRRGRTPRGRRSRRPCQTQWPAAPAPPPPGHRGGGGRGRGGNPRPGRIINIGGIHIIRPLATSTGQVCMVTPLSPLPSHE